MQVRTYKRRPVHVVDKLNGWGINAIKMLPNLVVAVIVLVTISWFWPAVARTGRCAAWFSASPDYRHIARLMAGMTRLAIIGVRDYSGPRRLSLDRAVASLLAGVGILGIAFGLPPRILPEFHVAASFALHPSLPPRSILFGVAIFLATSSPLSCAPPSVAPSKAREVLFPIEKY